MPIRSGHFSFQVSRATRDAMGKVTWGTQARPLSYGGTHSIVRVFNSSERFEMSLKYFKLQKGNGSGGLETVDQRVYTTMSIDVAVGDVGSGAEGVRIEGFNGVVNTNPGGAAQNDLFEGSYDLVRTAQGELPYTRRRSGRFNFPKFVPDRLPEWNGSEQVVTDLFPVLLADLRLLPRNDQVVYRIQNTGEALFGIAVATGANPPTSWHDLEKQQGLDLTLMGGECLWVKRDKEAIRGVYEIVG